ncbi:Histone-lysine N-methyltransferase SETMAR [Anthophora quadrimaculata]
MSAPNTVIRAILLYEFKLGTNAVEASRKICIAFGGGSVTSRTAQRWFKKFVSGDESLEDEVRSGRPSSLNTDELRIMIETNPNLTCQVLAQRFQVSDETIRLHLHKMGKKWKLSKWVPHDLSSENKLLHLNICVSLLSRLKSKNFLNQILTCDEKWILYSNYKRNYHWLSPNDPVPQTPKLKMTPKKILFCVWWTSRGVVHHEYLKVGQTLTVNLYSEKLQKVQEKLKQKQPSLVNRRGILFLQDNARPRTAASLREKIMQFGWELLPHPPYSPDLSPTNYHLFLSLDNHMRGKKFINDTAIKEEVSQFLNSKDSQFYANGIFKLPSRWKSVVDCKGAYFNE